MNRCIGECAVLLVAGLRISALSQPPTDFTIQSVGILQNMVNPSLSPTPPEGSELPTVSYGGEGVPRVLKQYRFSLRRYIFPIRWSNQPNQSERLIYVFSVPSHCLKQFWFIINGTLGTNCSVFIVIWKKNFGNDIQIVVILSRIQHVKSLISSCTLLSRLFKPVAYTKTCVPDLSIVLVA